MPGRYDKGSPPTKEDFTGHVKDTETGLHYAGARYYSSAFARWTTTDPILGQKGPKALLKQDGRLLTMSSYNYAFGNPATLTDPTGLAPMDWYRDEEGNIVHDEDVQSQADLEEGQTYLGENVLQYQENGPTRLGTREGDWVNVFGESTTLGEAGAKGAAAASVPAAAQGSLLDAKSVTGGKALSRLKVGTRVFGQGATLTALGLSTLSEASSLVPGFGESDPIGTYEVVKGTVDAGLAYGSYYYGAGAVASFALEATPVGGGITAKEWIVRQATIGIIKAQVDKVIQQ